MAGIDMNSENILTLNFVLLYNLETCNYFIMQPGMKKHTYLTRNQQHLVNIFKSRAVQCKNLEEVRKQSKQYAILFKEEFPEFYI
jgi:Tfp pilus assembly protein PilO